MLNHALGLLDDHLGHLHVALGRFVEGGTDHLGGVAVADHVGDLLRSLVDEQNEEVHLRVVLDDRIGEVLHEHCLTGTRRSHDESAGALADGADEIHHAC